jgi:hypothetical protein
VAVCAFSMSFFAHVSTYHALLLLSLLRLGMGLSKGSHKFGVGLGGYLILFFAR